MIIDRLENIERYYQMIPGLSDAFHFFLCHRDDVPGRYTEGENIAIVQKNRLSDLSGSPFEAHRKYIDLQVVLEGSEGIGWSSASDQQASAEYDEEKDVWFFNGNSLDMKIPAGVFYICFPWDGHRCNGIAGQFSECRKVCVKIPFKGADL